MDATATGRWLANPVDSWQETRDTLHLYTQVVGTIRLADAPPHPNGATTHG